VVHTTHHRKIHLQYLNGNLQSYLSTKVMRICAAPRDVSLSPEASHWAGCHTAEKQKRVIASAGITRHWRPSQSRTKPARALGTNTPHLTVKHATTHTTRPRTCPLNPGPGHNSQLCTRCPPSTSTRPRSQHKRSRMNPETPTPKNESSDAESMPRAEVG